jgi:hypothetical protein
MAVLALGVLACRPATDALPRFPSPDDAILVAAEPEIGKPLPFHAKPAFKTTVSSSQMEDAYFIRVDRILYTVTVDDKGLVTFLSTSDPSFRVSEGLHVGSTVDELRTAGATGFAYESNWGCSAALPSGWRAAAEFVGEPLICQPEISWFFKRRR